MFPSLGSLLGCSDWSEGQGPLFRVAEFGRQRGRAEKFYNVAIPKGSELSALYI